MFIDLNHCKIIKKMVKMGNASSDVYRMYFKQTYRCLDRSRLRIHDLDDSMYHTFNGVHASRQ